MKLVITISERSNSDFDFKVMFLQSKGFTLTSFVASGDMSSNYYLHAIFMKDVLKEEIKDDCMDEGCKDLIKRERNKILEEMNEVLELRKGSYKRIR